MTARGRRRRLARVLAGGTLATALFVTQSPAALAHGRGGGHHPSKPSVATFDDQRVVELTTSGSRGRAGLAYHETRAKQVTATNAAVAYASCDGCRAVALSFQVVVADGAPTTLDVGNLAVALNENCEGCEAVAVAFQLVLASDRNLVLTGRGRYEIDRLRHELRALARSDRPVAEIQTTAEAMMGRVADVLASELKVRPKVRCAHDIDHHPQRVTDKHDRGGKQDRGGKHHGGDRHHGKHDGPSRHSAA